MRNSSLKRSKAMFNGVVRTARSTTVNAKTVVFVSLMFVAATVNPLYAETIVLQEAFDGPVGSPLNGWNGWTGTAGGVISNVVIDRGHSAMWTGESQWPYAKKGFSYSPGAGDRYVLTATLHAPDADATYADVRLATSGDRNARHVSAHLGHRELFFTQNAIYDNTTVRVPQGDVTVDVQLVISDESIACYYRNQGHSKWIHVGNLKAHNAISTYNTITITCDRNDTGAVDSLRLAAEPAEPKQESALQSK